MYFRADRLARWFVGIVAGYCFVERFVGVGIVGASKYLGEPPIHHLDFAECANHDIGRFQVAVNHVFGMCKSNRLTDLFKDPQKTRQVFFG